MIETGLGILSILAVAAAGIERIRARAFGDLALLLTFAALTATLAGAARWAPDTFAAWMQEDAWAEWTTFFLFVTAGILNLWIARSEHRAEGEPPLRLVRVGGALGLAAFAFFVAGEEISWAQRMFAFEPPEFFLENNYQQELNLHNILKGEELAGISLDSRWLVVMIAVGYSVLLPLLELVSVRGQRWIPPVLVPRLWTRPCFLVVAAAEIAYPVSLTGEAAELALGLAFVVDALSRQRLRVEPGQEGSEDRGWGLGRLPTLAVAVPLALGVVTPSAVQSLLYGPANEVRAQTMEELQILASDVMDQSRGGALRFDRRSRVHKRLFTAVRDGYLRFDGDSRFLGGRSSPAEPTEHNIRRDRRGYFLDPWNNPYWVLYERRSTAVTLYSFGANRRRDTNVRGRPFRVGGDDLVVVLSLRSADGSDSIAER